MSLPKGRIDRVKPGGFEHFSTDFYNKIIDTLNRLSNLTAEPPLALTVDGSKVTIRLNSNKPIYVRMLEPIWGSKTSVSEALQVVFDPSSAPDQWANLYNAGSENKSLVYAGTFYGYAFVDDIVRVENDGRNDLATGSGYTYLRGVATEDAGAGQACPVDVEINGVTKTVSPIMVYGEVEDGDTVAMWWNQPRQQWDGSPVC